MKKLLLFFGLICMINLMFAQEMRTIHQNGRDFQVSAVRSVTDYPASDIQFWVGSGSNSAVIVFKWCLDEDSGLGIAYGYRWNGTATLYDLLTDIAAADPRFSVTFTSTETLISQYSYTDNTYNLSLETPGNCVYFYGTTYFWSVQDDIVSGSTIEMEEWGDCYPFPATTPIIPATDPSVPSDPVDAFLPFSSLQYWVGTGSNSVEFIVNFAQPDTAFAWGFRFDGTTTAQAMVDAIAAADPRFWTEGTPSNGGDIHFVLDNGDTLGLSPIDPAVGWNFWWTNLNGVSAGSGSAETLHDGDVFKYGDLNSAIGWDFQYGFYMEEAWTKVPTPVTPPVVPVEPDTLCTTIHPLTYSEDFSSYTSNSSMRPYFAGAPIPECWTVYGNGTVYHSGNGTSTDADYFGGVGYSTSTNSFGAIAANDAFFAFIASQIYTGTNESHINDMLTTGTRRYAILPAFDAPLSQTVLTFDHRTNMKDTNAHLMVGYIVNDTADFVALETYVADNKVLHHDTIHFSQYANMPDNARLALMWDVASTTASTTGPGNRYCGIDNLSVALDSATPIDTVIPGPTPVEATISANDILYWVGEGTNEAVMAVNWADTALAWGYRWNGTATVADMMADIAAADPRFSYTLNGIYIDDINFIDTAAGMTTPLGITPNSYWGSTNNGVMDMGMSETLNNGDFEKWADSSTGILVDSVWMEEWGGYWNYIYVYPMTIYPVSVPVIDTTPVIPVPVEATIAFSDILFWVGSGSNEAVMAVNWADTALAWGYRWNGTATVASMMAEIATADPRFSYELGTWGLDDILFAVAEGDTLRKVPFSYWESKNNGTMDAGMSQTLVNGDFEKWAEPAAGVIVDSMEYGGVWYYSYVYPMTIYPVSEPVIDTTPVVPVPVEATIDFNDILFWVGEGSNEAVMAVNWADTALAWGYRWNGTATVSEMMAHIAAADPRFSYELGTWGLDDILFAVAEGDTLRKVPFSYWESKNNGMSDMGMGQTLVNGDLEKWAEPAAGVIVDSMEYGGVWYYSYVYPMTIHPVSVPDTTGGGPGPQPEHGPFCGPVGSEGCNAIAANDNQFVAWATGVVLTRGPYMITEPDGPYASFGGDTNAIGPATMDNTMDAVSLGDGGSALVTFERPIRNGEGPDFAVFENSFNDTFLELAFVEVSSDGEHFVRFPATSLTPTDEQVSGAVGGVDATMLNNLAGKFRIGYGTPFDLEELAGSENLDIDSIVYVRIIDVIGTIDPQYATYDAYGHIVNDPWPTNFWSSGYDLTGVGVIHQRPVGIQDRDITRITVYPNPCSDRIYINLDEVQKVELYNMSGRLLEMIQPDDTHFMLDMQQYPAGMYLLKVGNGVQKIMKK